MTPAMTPWYYTRPRRRRKLNKKAKRMYGSCWQVWIPVYRSPPAPFLFPFASILMILKNEVKETERWQKLKNWLKRRKWSGKGGETQSVKNSFPWSNFWTCHAVLFDMQITLTFPSYLPHCSYHPPLKATRTACRRCLATGPAICTSASTTRSTSIAVTRRSL